MRRLVSMLCVFALAACGGGGARSVVPTDTSSSSTQNGPAGSGRTTGRAAGVVLSTKSLAFTGTGWSARQVVKTTWTDDTRKSAVSSDESVVTVTPPYQLAQWSAPNAYSASYFIIPVAAGKATITFSDHNGMELAQLSVTVTAPPTETLYVLSSDEVDAFPAAANGSTAPARRIRGFYRPFTPGVPHNSGGATAVGAQTDGTIVVLTSYQAGPTSAECGASAFSAVDGGPAAWPGGGCGGLRGFDVARGRGSEVDLLVYGYDGNRVVERLVNGRLTGSLRLPGVAGWSTGGLTTDEAGTIYVATYAGATSQSSISLYPYSATDGSPPTGTIAAPAGSTFGSLAFAHDGTLYAVISNATSVFINAYPWAASSPSRTIGPFAPDSIVGLACDHGGDLYVALASTDQSRVDVFAPDANGSAAPVRTIPNPIPADAVGGRAISAIGLGPPQAPQPEEVLGRVRRP